MDFTFKHPVSGRTILVEYSCAPAEQPSRDMESEGSPEEIYDVSAVDQGLDIWPDLSKDEQEKITDLIKEDIKLQRAFWEEQQYGL